MPNVFRRKPSKNNLELGGITVHHTIKVSTAANSRPAGHNLGFTDDFGQAGGYTVRVRHSALSSVPERSSREGDRRSDRIPDPVYRSLYPTLSQGAVPPDFTSVADRHVKHNQEVVARSHLMNPPSPPKKDHQLHTRSPALPGSGARGYYSATDLTGAGANGYNSDPDSLEASTARDSVEIGTARAVRPVWSPAQRPLGDVVHVIDLDRKASDASISAFLPHPDLGDPFPGVSSLPSKAMRTPRSRDQLRPLPIGPPTLLPRRLVQPYNAPRSLSNPHLASLENETSATTASQERRASLNASNDSGTYSDEEAERLREPSRRKADQILGRDTGDIEPPTLRTKRSWFRRFAGSETSS